MTRWPASRRKYKNFGKPSSRARAHWDGEIKPLLLAFDPSNPQTAICNLLAVTRPRFPGTCAHLDEVVNLLDQDAAEDARGLAIFQAVVLGLTLLLGAVGLLMARHLVSLPLRRLIDGAQAIAAGAYDRYVRISSRDELGELAETFNRMAGAIKERTSQLNALNRMAIAVTSSLDLKEVLDQIMRRGIELTSSKASCIAFYDRETQRFTEWVTQGLSEHFVQNMSFRPGGLADEAFTTTTTTTTTVGTYILSNDRPETQHKLSKLARDEGIKSFICLPLTSHANRLGVIYFYRSDRDTFDAGRDRVAHDLRASGGGGDRKRAPVRPDERTGEDGRAHRIVQPARVRGAPGRGARRAPSATASPMPS